MGLFKKKQQIRNISEERFESMMKLVKDLDRANYRRLVDAMELGYQSYQKVRNVKTTDEKEIEDIVASENILIKEAK